MRIKDKKKFIRAVSIIAAILLIIIIAVAIKNANKKYDDIGDFKDVKEVLEYLGCTYIRKTNAKEENYDKKIFVKFNKDLYENEKSNERFFSNLVQMVTAVNKYKSIILIDEERNITIKILCNKDRTALETYYINDIEDYFAKQNSNNNIDNLPEERLLDITINSQILNKAIKTKWIENDINFGSKESEFAGYNIYAEEGIKTKVVGNKVFNIVFTKNYKQPVINNIKVGTSVEEIQKILGIPLYTDTTEIGLIGYKSKDIYIFFTETEISVYRNDTTYSNEFYDNMKKFANNEIDFQTFVDNLTSIWQDYDEYTVKEDYYKLLYTLKGIEVQVSSANKDGVNIYSNYIGLYKNEDIKSLINSGRVHLCTNENLVHNTEIQRILKDRDLTYAYSSYAQVVEPDKPTSKLFYYQVTKDENDKVTKVGFLSVDGQNINNELKENMNSYIWYNDSIFLYGKTQDGIYAYDVINRKSKKILSGNDNFEIKGIEGNKLKYDNKSVELAQ